MTEEFRQILLSRLDSMEHKLDRYSAETLRNTADIRWIKTTFKTGLSLAVAAATAAFTYISAKG